MPLQYIFITRQKHLQTQFFTGNTKIMYLWLLFTSSVIAQQTFIKSFSSGVNSIEIATNGLDEIKILNAKNNEIEISLFDENPYAHHIINEEASVLKIAFQLEFIETNSIFKKFITKRLNRASAIIKLPKNKDVTILGTNIDVISKNYNGNLYIYIDKGFVNLNAIQQNAYLKLFQGNVFATLTKSAVNIKSTKGKILVNKKEYKKKYKNLVKNSTKTFQVSSINANVTCKILKHL